jgi:hypothetical protein
VIFLIVLSPTQAHRPCVFLLFFYTRSSSLVRCSHPRFQFAPAVDLGIVRLLGFFVVVRFPRSSGFLRSHLSARERLACTPVSCSPDLVLRLLRFSSARRFCFIAVLPFHDSHRARLIPRSQSSCRGLAAESEPAPELFSLGLEFFVICVQLVFALASVPVSIFLGSRADPAMGRRSHSLYDFWPLSDLE